MLKLKVAVYLDGDLEIRGHWRGAFHKRTKTTIFTHRIDGLTENDSILAVKVDRL